MTTVHAIRAHDSTYCADQALLDFHAVNGPPYIFGSNQPKSVGELFQLGDQNFRIVRMTTRQEWLERTRPPWLPEVEPVCYFEAVTD